MMDSLDPGTNAALENPRSGVIVCAGGIGSGERVGMAGIAAAAAAAAATDGMTRGGVQTHPDSGGGDGGEVLRGHDHGVGATFLVVHVVVGLVAHPAGQEDPLPPA